MYDGPSSSARSGASGHQRRRVREVRPGLADAENHGQVVVGTGALDLRQEVGGGVPAGDRAQELPAGGAVAVRIEHEEEHAVRDSRIPPRVERDAYVDHLAAARIADV